MAPITLPPGDPYLIPIPVSASAHYAARVFFGLTIPLFTAALVTLIMRIIFKLQSGVRFGLDDYSIILGFLLATTGAGLLAAAVAPFLDTSKDFTTLGLYITSISRSAISIPIWSFAIGFIKLSVCFTLLRFQDQRSWTIILYILMGLIAAVSVGAGIYSVVECVPLKALWDPESDPSAKCMAPEISRAVSNFVGSFSIATDIILSLFPMTFLVRLRRPMIEKCLISILMAFGLTAAAASITKAVFVTRWAANPTSMYIGFTMWTLSAVEILIGSTAACLPCMKPAIQRLLAKVGVDFTPNFSEFPVLRDVGHTIIPKEEGKEDGSVSKDVSGPARKNLYD